MKEGEKKKKKETEKIKGCKMDSGIGTVILEKF